MKTIVKITPKDSALHYWDSKGINQELFDSLTDSLMPAVNEGKTVHSELIRCVNRLGYDYCNNGNCNVVWEDEKWDDDDEYGYSFTPGVRHITEYFAHMFDFIERTFDEAVLTVGVEFKEAVKVIREIRGFVIAENDGDDYFSDKNMAMYDRMIDYALLYITNTEDSEIDFEI